jgi:hypothetical protein
MPGDSGSAEQAASRLPIELTDVTGLSVDVAAQAEAAANKRITGPAVD